MSFGPQGLFSTRRGAFAYSAYIRRLHGAQVLETWWAMMSVQWLAPGCCRVYKSDDGMTGTCEIDLLGKLGAV